MGTEFLLEMMKCSKIRLWWSSHSSVNIGNTLNCIF